MSKTKFETKSPPESVDFNSEIANNILDTFCQISERLIESDISRYVYGQSQTDNLDNLYIEIIPELSLCFVLSKPGQPKLKMEYIRSNKEVRLYTSESREHLTAVPEYDPNNRDMWAIDNWQGGQDKPLPPRMIVSPETLTPEEIVYKASLIFDQFSAEIDSRVRANSNL